MLQRSEPCRFSGGTNWLSPESHRTSPLLSSPPSLLTSQGLFTENKEKLINAALNALLEKEGDRISVPNEDLEAQFHALRRLVASKAGFEAFTQLPK